jgi:hypothetical protein
MKMTTLISAAALVPLLAVSPVLAQGSSSAASSLASSALNASASASAEASAHLDMSGLLATLAAGNATVDLSGITDASVINFVTVSSLPPSETPDALDTALQTNKAAVDKLRADIGANAVLSAKLRTAGYTADQVVAVVTETDGSVTVYVDDRA